KPVGSPCLQLARSSTQQVRGLMATPAQFQEIEACKNCQKTAKHDSEPACRACYWPIAMFAPNAKRAERLSDHLAVRFNQASLIPSQQGTSHVLLLTKSIGEKTVPVVAVPVHFAFSFFQTDRTLYAPYAHQVAAGTRAPAEEVNDKHRRIVDTTLYGGSGSEI